MKTIIIVITLILSSNIYSKSIIHNHYKSINQISHLQDTLVLPQILTLPLSDYIGKPIDSLLIKLPMNYTNRIFMGSGRWGYSRGISQGYGTEEFNHCFVEIFIDTFQYLPMPNFAPYRDWNMELAKKETITFIKVWKNNVCVYECKNPVY